MNHQPLLSDWRKCK